MAEYPFNAGRPRGPSSWEASRSPQSAASQSRIDLTLPPLRSLETSTTPDPFRFPPSPQLSARRYSSTYLSQNPPAHYPVAFPPSAMGSPLPPPGVPPPMQQMPPFYQQAQPIAQPPQHMSIPAEHGGQALRYPLPATPDSRAFAGARNKKEIKRRTKTGCLTCRKRRIKCDEGHPTCRNCQKSKRDCLGYDPIFKSQSGPAAIQPAPNAATPSQPSITMATFPQPSAGPGSAAAPAFDYSSAIDPSLETVAGHLASETRLIAPPMKIEDVLSVGSGISPPAVTSSSALTPQQQEDIKTLYISVYAAGLDKFLESKWFSTRAQTHLLNNPALCEKYKVLLSRFNITAASDFRGNLITQSLEAHVIWETFMLARQVSASISSTNDPNATLEINEGVHETAKRVEVFEALVTNQTLDPANAISDIPSNTNPTTPATIPKPALDDQLRSRERDFWRHTSKFCTLKDNSKSAAENPNEEIEKVLKEMRLLLDSRENRDIIYSIAIARHIGHQLAEKAAAEGDKAQAAGAQPLSNNEDDPRTKVGVAKNFIISESGGKGTTQVAQRVCGMAVMSWTPRQP